MAEGVRIELMCVKTMIENEIKQGLTQRQIAQTYALGIRSSDKTDWAAVNKLIVDRWSVSGLGRIKKMVWSGSCFSTS